MYIIVYICIYLYIFVYICIYLYIYVVGVMKVGNIVPRVGIECTYLAFQASVLPLYQVDSLMSPLYPRLPVYAVPYLRGQCRLLHSSP